MNKEFMQKHCEVVGYWIGDMATIVQIRPVDKNEHLRNDLFWFSNDPGLRSGDKLTFQQFYDNCQSGRWQLYKQEKFRSMDQIPNDVSVGF